MFENIKSDTGRYMGDKNEIGLVKAIFYLIFTWEYHAVLIYRFGRFAKTFPVPIVSHILKLVAFLLFKWIEIIAGISIPASADIGPGFFIGHFGGIFLHTNVKMGKNCSIGTGVVIGTRGVGNTGVPEIGDNVYIGVGAKVLGSIKIGHNVKIGANAVVIENIPDNSTSVGIPARIIPSSE